MGAREGLALHAAGERGAGLVAAAAAARRIRAAGEGRVEALDLEAARRRDVDAARAVDREAGRGAEIRRDLARASALERRVPEDELAVAVAEAGVAHLGREEPAGPIEGAAVRVGLLGARRGDEAALLRAVGREEAPTRGPLGWPVSSPDTKRPLPSGKAQTMPFTSSPPSAALRISTSCRRAPLPTVARSTRRMRFPSATRSTPPAGGRAPTAPGCDSPEAGPGHAASAVARSRAARLS